MSEHDLLLREFQPHTALITEDHTPPRARYPVVDAHNHLRRALDRPAELLELMDALNLHAIVDLDGGWGEQLDQHLSALKAPYPDRFCVFAWVDWSEVDDPDFGARWAGRLADAVGAGAQGLKVFKSLGLFYRDRSDVLIQIDDPRLDPVWAAAGELGIPVLIHSADPVAFFWPLDAHNERWEELQAHPDWHFYGGDYPSFIELIEAQLRVVARHPETTFVSAHVLSYSEHLRYVAQQLDAYPNLYVDIGARLGEMGRQPYTARWFLTDYADRVLFGTDARPHPEVYRTYFRCLETADEYFEYGSDQGRYRIYGLYLPDEVLRKVYYENACRLIPGLALPSG